MGLRVHYRECWGRRSSDLTKALYQYPKRSRRWAAVWQLKLSPPVLGIGMIELVDVGEESGLLELEEDDDGVMDGVVDGVMDFVDDVSTFSFYLHPLQNRQSPHLPNTIAIINIIIVRCSRWRSLRAFANDSSSLRRLPSNHPHKIPSPRVQYHTPFSHGYFWTGSAITSSDQR